MGVSRIGVLWMAAAALILAASPRLVAADDYDATLTGDQSVPPVNTPARGQMEIEFEDETFGSDYMEYKVTTDSPIMGLRYVSLNLGQPGSSGPVVAYLLGPQPPTNVPAGTLIEGRLTRSQLQGPYAGRSIDDLEDAVDDEEVYGLISYETGALRGYFDD